MVLAIALCAAPARAAGRCGAHPWCGTSLPPDRRADLLEAAMSQSDKVAMLRGGPAADVGVPQVRFVDGPLGPASDGAIFGEPVSTLPATALPAGIALAAGFDPAQAERFGAVVGDQVKHRGFDGDWGPTVNVMRTPLGGRTFEAYGEDPFLVGRTAAGWIRGAQSQGVMATVKHFAANNQEGQVGVVPGQGVAGGRNTVNAIVSERELQEIELPAFEAAVRAGVASVMCAYNQVDGVYACDDADLLQGVLRRQFGFPGIILSDAGAAKTPAGDLNAGMDWDIVGNSDNAPAVDLALATGQVTQATLDARVHETLRTLFAYGYFDRAAYVDDPSQDHRSADAAVGVQTAEQGMTLLQNRRGVLPLDPRRVHSIAVVGAPAGQYVKGDGSSEVMPRSTTTGLEGLQARAARAAIRVTYDDGSNPSQAAADARAADAAVVFAADSEGEGDDKLCMSLVPQCAPTQQSAVANLNPLASQSAWGDQDALISSVAAANPRTVVVLETGAPVLTPWRGAVAGLLEAWYPGQDGGTAIARVLFGDAEPGGRLPVTFPRSAGDEPTAGDLNAYPGTPGPIFQAHYDEGVLVGYRWFDAHRLKPAFPFGFGLSYARFGMRGLRIAPSQGGPGARVSITVTNIGRRAGEAVPELYLGLPRPSPALVEPPAQLAGFQKLSLGPGQSRRVTFAFGARALSYWDPAAHAWKVAPGCTRVMVGSSSRAIAASGLLAQGGRRACGPAKRRRSAARRHRTATRPRARRRAHAHRHRARFAG